MTTDNSTLLDARAFDRTLRRMADEIVELNDGTDDLDHRRHPAPRRSARGAHRVARSTSARSVDVPQRRARHHALPRRPPDRRPAARRRPDRSPVDIDGKHVVIVDDVLYTGRTVRAALDELADFGRPTRIALAVLDRSRRTRAADPADIVGKTVDVGADAARRRAGRGARRTRRASSSPRAETAT